ncbi:MAG: response regulator transcription factor [Bacteroidetes bacterium]|nr:MAG: response regulator transcription factor [Bacteroidota bacterium]
MKKIRVLLIEDNRLLREGIALMLKKNGDIDVVAASGNAENSILNIHELKPDLILLDLGLRNQNNLHVVELVAKEFPQAKVIVMDIAPAQGDILQFVKAGVSGFILKDATIDDFLRTIRLVAQGANVLPSLMTGSLFSQIVEHAVNRSEKRSSKLMESVRMTKRERQVIELVSDGMTNKEIAQKLNLSPYTVKSHIHNILEKLALHTRVQIARYSHASESFQDIANTISHLDE